MKKLAASLSLVLFLVATSRPCVAMMSIEQVSRPRAKELGIEVRFAGSGPDAAWVELEFKPEGGLKGYRHTSLEIREGGKLLVGYAPMEGKRTSSGSVVVRFMANRAYLDKVTLSVVTGDPMDLTGHELRMAEFFEPGKVR